ncbi:NAD(P)-dependent dehydrogenase, short-chain alcohol dehydrogenase family [Chitinophaga sp. YR627]|jgi:NAD(P)-dependent dehydrogenase (short-subunit alcohol dehydrogenase family)|uniref:SDR family NAD(P)-dependent oxidoreductase n=1 Tax=Chitinophaga TaxID=79328 RepID=UPI0008DFA617|nr:MULTISPECIES: glucose 1-dehydrogenase [Chitinophaga]SFN36366.1 NAD(P)-dependent dehydrogenase, short-chain alcohol dehydrogenase family [Chitinophaga sp. YR627]
MNLFRLDNKVAVITGGGSGIGQAIAKVFAAQGADVHIIELNEEGGKQTAAEIAAAGGTAQVHACNVAQQAAVVSTVDKIIAAAGRIDILVNCAGIAHVGKLESTTEEDLDRVYNVNVKGTYNCMFAVIKQMKEQKGGVILNVASIASSVGIPDRFAYSMSKGAVLTMTLSVAKDYINDGIRCNCVSPARVHTPFVDGFIAKNYPGKEQEMFDKLSKTQPIGRMAKPDEVGTLALFLCSAEAGFITGCDYPLDGGFIKLNN